MFYAYVIRSKKNGRWYTGSTSNLRKRFKDHNNNQVFSTKNRGPFELIYYEACLNEQDGRVREKYLKSGMGKRYLKSRLKRFLSLTGFTLIELIIVAAIIAVLVAISTPLFRETLRDLELKDAAYNVSKLIRYGQEKAVIEEKKHRILFNFDKRSYHLVAESEKGREEEEPSDEIESAPTEEGKPTTKWKRAAGRFGEYFYLPDGIEFKGDKDKITFLPNGRCDKISLHLNNAANETIEIKTNGKAGHVKVSEPKKE
jgi:putative endonuclease